MPPTGVPSPYVAHIHPYPTRFHGGVWRRPAFGLPYVRQPLNILRPSQMTVPPNATGPMPASGLGFWDTGSGVFRRPTSDGGGIFNEISGLGDVSPQVKTYLVGGMLGFGLIVFLATRKKKGMTPNSSCGCGGHKKNGSRYFIETRHASGSSHWDREPGEGPFATREEAEKVKRWFENNEPTDEDGNALQYRVASMIPNRRRRRK